MNQKSETVQIGKYYSIVRPLFQVNHYLYAQVCSLKGRLSLLPAAILSYDNEDPVQSLRMLSEKFDLGSRPPPNLIFPVSHASDIANERKIALFVFDCHPLPLSRLQTPLGLDQLLEVLHASMTCLSALHSKQIIHGRISPNTGYLIRKKQNQLDKDGNGMVAITKCRFALNILDTSCFPDEEGPRGVEQLLFQSEGQALNLKVSYKDDLESLVYLMVHLLSRGTLLTATRFQLEWYNETELLRWKSTDFFKEMVKLVPQELSFLVELYTMVKSLERHEKPDYSKIIKKINLILALRKKPVGTKEFESIKNKSKKLNQSGMSSRKAEENSEQFMTRTKFEQARDPSSRWTSTQQNTQSVQDQSVDQNNIVLGFDQDDQSQNLQENEEKHPYAELSDRMNRLGHRPVKKSVFKPI